MNAAGTTGMADISAIAPELLLAIAGAVILLLEAFTPRLRSAFSGLAVIAVAAAGWLVWGLPAGSSWEGLLTADRTTAVGSLIVLVSAGLALLASQSYLQRERILGGEYHALFLWCTAGMLLMLRSTELLTVFVCLELLSLCLYALAAYDRKTVVGSEAAIKYFLMGAFASAFVLYGVALLYGATGSTFFERIAAAFAAGSAEPWFGSIGVLLMIAGFGFKMSIAPFHAWAPDTYQGAPSPFVAFLSVAPKAASAFVMIRVLATVFPDALGTHWPSVIASLAVLSMIVGNLLALVQDDIKRMLAYSGVGHMGYLLIPLAGLDLAPGPSSAGGGDVGATWTAVLVYLAAYALMNAGAFAVISLLYTRSGEQHLISDLSGKGYRHPLLGLALTVCMLSLGGIPPTLGFLGKYFVFFHAVQHGQTWLALVGVATSVVGVYYYLRVVYHLYMKEEVQGTVDLRVGRWGTAAAVLAALGTLILGIVPGLLLGLL